LIESFRYGKSSKRICLNDKYFISHFISQKTTQNCIGESNIVEKALTNTNFPLCKHVKRGDKVAIVVSDQTRPTGSHVYVPMLINKIMKIGVDKVIIIIALGLHRPPSDTEMNAILGDEIPKNIPIINHNPLKGLTKVGGALFRKEILEVDKLIITGAVTFHPMAGFSGGRKSLLPGIASSTDIYKNHRLYFNGNEKHKKVGPGMIEGNPITIDIKERTSAFKNLWALNVVLGEDNKITFASCGDIDKVWDECSLKLMRSNTVKFKEHSDVVIASAGGYPSDFSFYQSMKVLTNSSKLCKKGGTLIVFSECSNGWEINKILFKYFSMTKLQIIEDLNNNFTMDGLALYMAINIIRNYKVWLYSSLPRKEVELSGMNVIDNLKSIENILNRDNKIAILPKGSSTLPVQS